MYISYSSKRNRSTKLMRDVLNTMNITLLNIVRKHLYAILENKPIINRNETESLAWYEPARNALNCIERVERPFSLQHLARMSVICAMSGRSLQSASTLGLPTCILDYLILKID